MVNKDDWIKIGFMNLDAVWDKYYFNVLVKQEKRHFDYGLTPATPKFYGNTFKDVTYFLSAMSNDN